MALHDFECPSCGRIYRDVNVPIEIGAMRGAPPCLNCGVDTEWIPQIGRMDAYEPFHEFTVRDGRNQEVVVDSLAKLRKIERESETAERNGEGQRMVWRKYSQDRSNVHVHTLGKDPQEAPSRAAAAKFGPAIRRRAEEPSVTYGPGVNDLNASALRSDV